MTRPWRRTHWRIDRPIRTTLRTLYHANGGRCSYCRRNTVLPPRAGIRDPEKLYASTDHKVPKVRGGDNRRGNLTMACEPCNQTKADMAWHDWLAFMAENPEWWERARTPTTEDDGATVTPAWMQAQR